MSKFSVDYSNLDQQLSQAKVYRYADVKDRLVKVAFDIVRFNDTDGIDGLWQIQATDDGEVIVAMYEDGSAEPKLEAKSSWDAVSDKTGANVHVFYKGEPVTKIASAQYGIPNEEAELLCETLTEKLASNSALRSGLLANLSVNERKALASKFPELFSE